MQMTWKNQDLSLSYLATGDDDLLLDPYLLWAHVTNYRDYPAKPPDADTVPWMLVLLDLGNNSVSDFINVAKNSEELIRIPSIYEKPAKGLNKLTFCTARISDAFLGEKGAALRKKIRRLEMGLPIVGEVQGRPGGQGVLNVHVDLSMQPTVVVIDDGLPFANRLFLDRQSKPRFLGLWDQNQSDQTRPSDVPAPSGLNYGRHFGPLEIAGAMAAHGWGAVLDEASVYQQLGLDGLRHAQRHGAAVLTIAAGQDSGPPANVSPLRSGLGADLSSITILGIQLPAPTSDDTSGGSLAPHVLDAMHFALSEVDERARVHKSDPGPVIANLSYGRFAGPHDGSSLLECALDQLIGLRNHAAPFAVVLPAGNGQLNRGHAQMTLRPKQTASLRWRVLPDDRTPSFLELRPASPAGGADLALTVTIRPPVPSQPVDVVLGSCQQLSDAEGRPVCMATYLKNSASGDGPIVLIALAPTAGLGGFSAVAPAGTWEIGFTVKGDVEGDGEAEIRAWIQRDDVFPGSRLSGRQSYFEDSEYVRFDRFGQLLDEDPQCLRGAVIRRVNTINAIATGKYPVVVGARRAADGKPAPYTASGESGDRWRRPDAVMDVDRSAATPGMIVGGCLSGSAMLANGTSLAAPQVTRLLAAAFLTGRPPVEWKRNPAWARDFVSSAAAAQKSAHRPTHPNPWDSRLRGEVHVEAP